MTAASSPSPASHPSICPLCGGDNACAAQAGLDPRSCWCMKAGFPPGLLERVPPELRRQACICRSCLERYREEHPEER
ncbi:cysteine-rich CWC family protein [Gorillibacterium sp. sgz5001074]|uniref:cysteine-rich CWC family protein n=1 Tax=Gorillibacterium sp. sgz5001074 TaxID=3446695 RepID=UPI003F661FA2